MCERSTQLTMLKSAKNIVLGLASISMLASLSACTKQRIYYLGEENVHGDWTVVANIDEENERFVLDFKPNKSKPSTYTFFFILSYGKEHNAIKNTDGTRELVYRLYDGEEITFDEGGSYFFTERTYINVFYTYAGQEVKQSIKDKDYNLQFGCGHYEPPKEQ